MKVLVGAFLGLTVLAVGWITFIALAALAEANHGVFVILVLASLAAGVGAIIAWAWDS